MIYGGAESDSIFGGSGRDQFFGGTGIDHIEVVIGSNFNDDMVGTNQQDTLSGAGGDDDLEGGFGNDFLVGGAGDDTLNGGAGDDILIGGETELANTVVVAETGSDTAVFAGVFADFTINDVFEFPTPEGVILDVVLITSDLTGTDTLIGIEVLQFDDQTVAVADLIAARAGPTEGDDVLEGTNNDDEMTRCLVMTWSTALTVTTHCLAARAPTHWTGKTATTRSLAEAALIH